MLSTAYNSRRAQLTLAAALMITRLRTVLPASDFSRQRS